MPILDIFSKRKAKPSAPLRIIIDHREKNSLVISELMKKGFEIEFKQLPVADYLIKNIAIERKTVTDLKSSIINKRIIQQLLELKQYSNHLLIVEGIIDEDIYQGQMHENAFRGFLLTVALEFRTPIIFTHNAEDTAKYISVLAKKEKSPEPSIRASKIFLSKKEQIQFILEGFPNLGPKTARALMNKFKTLNNIFNASEKELRKILGKRAKNFMDLLN